MQLCAQQPFLLHQGKPTAPTQALLHCTQRNRHPRWRTGLPPSKKHWNEEEVSEGSLLQCFHSKLLPEQKLRFCLLVYSQQPEHLWWYWRPGFKFVTCLLWKIGLNIHLCPRRVCGLWPPSNGAVPLPARPLSEHLLSGWFQVIDPETWTAALAPGKKTGENYRRWNWNRFISECPGTGSHPKSP